PARLRDGRRRQVVESDGPGQGRRPAGNDDLAQVREAIGSGEIALLLGIDDDRPRLTIVENEARLLRLIAEVDRYRNKASLPAGEVGDQHLGAVAHPEGDAVTRLQVGAQPLSGEATGAVVELAVAQAATTANRRDSVGGGVKDGHDEVA